MNHPWLWQLIIGYTCVFVFVLTAIITLLSLVGLIKLERGIKDKLLNALVLEVIAVGVAAFTGALNVDEAKVRMLASDPEVQTLRASLNRGSFSFSSDVSPDRPRVYFQIRDASQRDKAQQLADNLANMAGVIVPGIESLDVGPSVTELRYFKPADESEAKQIAADISQLNVKVLTKFIPGFESTEKVMPRQYELWLSSDWLPSDGG
jgi:outer membrane murein-binding lipoprotein Lpp